MVRRRFACPARGRVVSLCKGHFVKPYVGQPIQFLAHASRSAVPCAGFITEVLTNGECHLALMAVDRSQLVLMAYVRHIDDPWVVDHPEAMRQPRAGAWKEIEDPRVVALERKFSELESLLTEPAGSKRGR